MNTSMDALDAVAEALADALAGRDVRMLEAEELLEYTTAMERLGRLADAARVAAAGEVADRSRKELGAQGLAATHGCRNANELLQRITLVSPAAAEKRIRLGGNTRANVTLVGFVQPARFPAVAAALNTGELGVDSAEAIIRSLLPALEHSDLHSLAAAERELVAAATGTGEDSPVPCPAQAVFLQGQIWQCVLNPDGAEVAEQGALRKRFLRIGREHDGLVRLSGELIPEIAGKLARLLDCGLAPKTAPAFLSAEEQKARAAAETAAAAGGGVDAAAAEDPAGPAAAEAGLLVVDSRTRQQQSHDVFASLIDTIARSGDTPTIGGMPPTVLVTVRAEDLASGHGVGHIDGLETPVPVRSVKQMACNGGSQQVVIDDTGRIIELGSPQRCFTPAQRRAIQARDGGCLIPGCHIPAGWTEIHHVQPDSEGGPTHVDNGVCLCWWHHHMLEMSGWQIRMHYGTPQVKAPPWLDPGGQWKDTTKAPTTLINNLKKRLGQ